MKAQRMETQKKGTPDRDVLIGTVVREGESGGVTPGRLSEVLTEEGYELPPEEAKLKLAAMAEAGDIEETEPGLYKGV